MFQDTLSYKGIASYNVYVKHFLNAYNSVKSLLTYYAFIFPVNSGKRLDAYGAALATWFSLFKVLDRTIDLYE